MVTVIAGIIKIMSGFDLVKNIILDGVVVEDHALQRLAKDSEDESGLTLLHFCCQSNNGEVNARKLISMGFEVDKADECGNTPLIEASIKGRGEIVSLLVEAGANVNHQNDMGESALSSAAAWGHLEIVSFLLKHGALTSLKDVSGKSPLDYLGY